MENSRHDLSERLSLIESMISEGRRSSQRWAWSFLLWGVAYYVAIAWANWGNPSLAWPVTMIAAAIVTGLMKARVRRNQPGTTIGRALLAVWSVMGVVLFALTISLSLSHHFDSHVIVAVIAAMLAVANGISSLILRWKMQSACAIVWLATAIGACFVSDEQLIALFLAAIFFCQIVFGIYGMILEARNRNQSVAHA